MGKSREQLELAFNTTYPIGKKFGQLTILNHLGRRRWGGKNRPFVKVKCECLYEFETCAHELKKGAKSKKSCINCKYKNSRIVSPGDVFDKLTVIDYESIDKVINKRKVICKCMCGNHVRKRPELLFKNANNNCGCIPRGNWHGQISDTFFGRIKRNAKVRKIKFSITKKYLWELFLSQNKKCALSGGDLYFNLNTTLSSTASLDRVDSNKPYVEDNVQWVHKDINKMKSDLSCADFIKWCRKVGDYGV